jgi:hypothetical protein
MSIIRARSGVKNQFFKISDSTGSELILYSTDNIIIIPQCIPVDSIEVEETERCTELLQVKFSIKNSTELIGFLTDENIIVKNSDWMECSKLNKKHYLEARDTLLVRKGKHLKIIDNYNFKLQKLEPNKLNISEFNNIHSSVLLEGIDMFKIHDITVVDEIDTTNEDSNLHSINKQASLIAASAKEIYNKYLSFFYALLTIVICLTVIAIILSIYHDKMRYAYKKAKEKKKNKHRSVENKNINPDSTKSCEMKILVEEIDKPKNLNSGRDYFASIEDSSQQK